MRRPLVSVIIVVFNRAPRLAEAINSVLSQSFHDFELLVIDDGSTDDTPAICHQFQDRIIYHRLPHCGVSVARNIGIERSRGEWIAFLDSDDLWLPEKLERQLLYGEQNPWYLIHQTDEKWIRNNREIFPKKKHQKRAGDIFQYCLPLCIISPSAVIIHRSVFEKVGKFDESLKVCEDYDLWLRVSIHYQVGFLAEKLIIKRGGHPDQLSNRYWGIDRFRVLALEKLLRTPLEHERRILVIEEIIRKLVILSSGREKRGGQNPFKKKLERYEKLYGQLTRDRSNTN